MQFVRAGETMTIKKNFPAGSTINEAEYSIAFQVKGLIKYLDEADITFVVNQPTVSTGGYLAMTLTVGTDWTEGPMQIRLQRRLNTTDTWTSTVGTAVVYVEKALTDILV